MQTPMTPVTIAKRQEIMKDIVEVVDDTPVFGLSFLPNYQLVNIAEQSVNTQEEETIPPEPEMALAKEALPMKVEDEGSVTVV